MSYKRSSYVMLSLTNVRKNINKCPFKERLGIKGFKAYIDMNALTYNV